MACKHTAYHTVPQNALMNEVKNFSPISHNCDSLLLFGNCVNYLESM